MLVPLWYSASLGQPRQCITCPGLYSYWSAKRGQMCLVCPTPCAVRLGITGAGHTRPCWYLAGTSFVQCFAWSAQAMYHLPGLVLVLVSQTRANVPSLPYPLRSSLGYHGRWTYSPVLVFVLVPLSYSASLGLYSASPGPYGSCTYLPLFALIPVPLVQLDSTGIVPFARVLNVPTCPCLYRTYVSALVSLYSVLLWVTRAMYVSSCLDSRAVTVSILPLIWTVCW